MFASTGDALRVSLVRPDEDLVVRDASLEPFAHELQNGAIANAVGHHLAHPVMLDMVEIAAKVRFEDPANCFYMEWSR